MERTSSNQQPSTQPPQQNPVLLRPRIIGFMSIDASRNYRSDLSQLKFVTNIPKGRLLWDLNHNVDQAVKRTVEDNVEKLDLILKFLLDQGSRLSTLVPEIPPDVFISYRRTLINIMASAYVINEPVCIRASFYKNKIYLHAVESAKTTERNRNCSDQEKRWRSWGMKFEKYMLSDQPHLSPKTDEPVKENEEFSLYFTSQLGDHHLLYSAQTDGLLATHVAKPTPETTDVHEIIDYLRHNHYVELKTNKELRSAKLERNFIKYKLLRCWCQCYLANYKGLFVGFRNDHGIVQRVHCFDIPEIAEICKREWEPQTMLNFLNYFLSFVKKTLYSYIHGNSLKGPLTLDFVIDFDQKIKVVVQDHEQDNTLLPDWYIDGLNK